LRIDLSFKEMISFVGHVQISQTPKRNCPMDEDGEVNHRYFLTKLVEPFYNDFIGLEYNGRSYLLNRKRIFL